jgi:hypothetical protein
MCQCSISVRMQTFASTQFCFRKFIFSIRTAHHCFYLILRSLYTEILSFSFSSSILILVLKYKCYIRSRFCTLMNRYKQLLSCYEHMTKMLRTYSSSSQFPLFVVILENNDYRTKIVLPAVDI